MPMWARRLTFSHGYTNLSQPRAWLWPRTPTTVLISAHDKASTEAPSEVLTVRHQDPDSPGNLTGTSVQRRLKQFLPFFLVEDNQ